VAAPDKGFNWNDRGISGSLRFIKKIFAYFYEVKIGKTDIKTESQLNKTIKNITEYYDNFDYRKATIELRELFDKIAQNMEVSKDTLEKFLKLLSPLCPHITEELWEKLGNKNFISTANWPTVDESKIKEKGQLTGDLTETIIKKVKPITDKFPDKKNLYLYVLPFEEDQIDAKKISEAIGKMVDVWSVKSADKYDPENKAKKARPGMPGLYLE
jgi:leucyl-tRNA synthetase